MLRRLSGDRRFALEFQMLWAYLFDDLPYEDFGKASDYLRYGLRDLLTKCLLDDLHELRTWSELVTL